MSSPPDLKTAADAQASPGRSQRWRITRPVWVTPGLITWTRCVTMVGWLAAFAIQIRYHGVPFDREGLLVWIVLGLVAASIGLRAPWTVIIDWLPFALVLLAYDYLRGVSDTLGMPTWWKPQLNVDKVMFGGTEPTIWLQEHFKQATAGWWDVTVSLTYVSFFVLPYLTAAVFWLRSRAEFHRWAARFVSLSLLGFGLFALIPAAPPWAAATCSAAQVADHPSSPPCMGFSQRFVPDGGLLGPIAHPRPGAAPYFERLSGRGWPKLHLGIAQSLVDKGQGTVDQVAAVPSLHAGGTMLFVLFIWSRARVWWKAVLVAYVLLMALALTYAGEHYFSDVLAGWLCAAAVSAAFSFFERRRKRSRPVDTLDGPPHAPAPTASRMENPCPPIATMPSSTSANDVVSSFHRARSMGAAAPPGTTGHSASS